MNIITFECEIVTPMFISGADGRTLELRPPSIKGLMRFWWRAMNGYLSLEDLKEEEAKIFGGSGENEGKSKVIIKIENNNRLHRGESNIKKDYNLDLKPGIGKDIGIGYLLYSTTLSGGKPYYKENQSFNLSLISSDSNALAQAAAAFWSLVYLGGIGTRARRGGGNIVITKVIDKDNVLGETGLDFLIKGRNSQEIAGWIIKNYDTAKEIVNKEKTRFISEYSNLSISRFIIANKHSTNWKKALNDIGKEFADFRYKNKDDVFGTAAFGLPRRHINANNIKRRSSPLIFKVLKSEGKYYWMVLRLAGEFLPEEQILILNQKSQASNFNKLDEFWNILKKEGTEHILSIPDELKDLRKKINEELSPTKITLFGSRARGDFHKKSDIDIAVDTDKSIGLADINGSVDIINLNRIDGPFREKIEQEGVKI